MNRKRNTCMLLLGFLSSTLILMCIQICPSTLEGSFYFGSFCNFPIFGGVITKIETVSSYHISWTLPWTLRSNSLDPDVAALGKQNPRRSKSAIPTPSPTTTTTIQIPKKITFVIIPCEQASIFQSLLKILLCRSAIHQPIHLFGRPRSVGYQSYTCTPE
jgi:hypothetical protein